MVLIQVLRIPSKNASKCYTPKVAWKRAMITREIVLGQVKGKKKNHSTSLSRYDMNVLQGAVVGTPLAPPVSTNLFVITCSSYPLPWYCCGRIVFAGLE